MPHQGERVLVESMGKEGFAKAQELHLAEMTPALHMSYIVYNIYIIWGVYIITIGLILF